MSPSIEASRKRLVAGVVLLVAGVVLAVLVLPDATQQRLRQQRASDSAKSALALETQRLTRLEQEDRRVADNRIRLDALMKAMPDQGVGRLQWALSLRLHELARKHNVRLQALKYGTPTREESKGTDLEILNVEFTASGVYQGLKPFMLDVEDPKASQLPFAVASAQMEEGPDGAKLSVVLRAFRRTAESSSASTQGGP